MVHTCLKLTGIVLIILNFGNVSSQTANTTATTTTGNNCSSQAVLTNLGWTLQAPAVVTNGTCSLYWNTTGSCVAPNQVLTSMNNVVTFLKAKAIDASSFGLLLINATMYWRRKNGFVTNTTVTTTTSTDSLSSILDNLLNTLLNSVYGIFSAFGGWLTTIFTVHYGSINPCLQSYANITNGLMCALSSNYGFDNSTAVKNGGFIALTTDPASAGNSLNACIPLIDTYCTLVWGISVTNTSAPFNITFNFTNFNDGGVKQADCSTLSAANNCTTTTCVTNRNTVLVNMFLSNRIPFIPANASIISLGNFFNGTADATTYTAVQQPATTGGIELGVGTSTSANFVSIGLSSGQPKQTYSALRMSMMYLFVLIFISLKERF